MSRSSSIRRITVTLSRSLVDGLISLRERYGVSVSGIVELALAEYFERNDERAIAVKLREAGARLRRSIPGSKRPHS